MRNERAPTEGNGVSYLRDKYFKTLGIDKSDRTMTERALKRAYELRNFEIEHYWKRATYFWAFQVAIFAAFGLLLTHPVTGCEPAASDWSPITVALAGLGILTAVANVLSAKGSRFWQDNWENHIDMLEDSIEGRLYKTVWLDDGTVSFSVSRVNKQLGFYFIVFWVLAFLYVVWNSTGMSVKGFFDGPGVLNILSNLHIDFAIFIVIMTALGWFLLSQRTDLSRGTLPNDDGSHSDIKVERCCFWRGRICGVGKSEAFIRRKAPDES